MPDPSHASDMARSQHPRASAHRRSCADAAVVRPVRVVALGGGTGLPVVLEGLCNDASRRGECGDDAITAVVTVTDDGGSSGQLRRELGVLPPGDVRNCLAAAARSDSPFRQLLQYRFTGSSMLDGHPVGNLLLAALHQMTGDFPQAVQRLGAIIGLRGRVLPTTAENVRLRAEMHSGEVLTGETRIVSSAQGIRRLTLEPSPRPLPEVLRALVNADAIIVGPGSLYTSIIPALLVEGIASTISGVDAVRIYVANLMTEPGETDGYTVDDHLQAICSHTGFNLFDYVLVNDSPVPPDLAAEYARRGSIPVAAAGPLRSGARAQIVRCDLAPDWTGPKIRHHPDALAQAILAVITNGRAVSSGGIPPAAFAGHTAPAIRASSSPGLSDA